MAYDAYDAYLYFNKMSSDATGQFKSDLQSLVNKSFEIASDYYVVSHRTRITSELLASTPEWNDVGVRLVTPFEVKKTTSLTDDYFKIIFKNFDYEVYLGDIFEFGNHRWMVMNTSSIDTVTKSVLVQRCNVKLKFTETSDLTSDIIEIDGVARKFAIDDLKQNQFIQLADNTLEVFVPNDYNGVKIVWTYGGGTRFLLGNPYQNWKTISYDNISLNRDSNDGTEDSGIIKLKLELSEINTGMDDLVNGIAWQDYF